MRWVDRGPEPGGVAGYGSRFTQGWIDYFENRVGWRPEDYYWREFRQTLGSRSNNICWYCERQCYSNAHTGDRAPTVDHFRPVSKFPALAYVWPNWVFSCRRCNEDYKGDGWPEFGYVDPCAVVADERPERYFDYDSQTGEIIPNIGLTGDARRKAWHTIEDLGLNKLDVRYYRFDHTQRFVEDLLALPVRDRQDFANFFTEQSVEYAGVTRMVVERAPELF
jgi:uncharacterized protein (TIGR02646 family)